MRMYSTQQNLKSSNLIVSEQFLTEKYVLLHYCYLTNYHYISINILHKHWVCIFSHWSVHYSCQVLSTSCCWSSLTSLTSSSPISSQFNVLWVSQPTTLIDTFLGLATQDHSGLQLSQTTSARSQYNCTTLTFTDFNLEHVKYMNDIVDLWRIQIVFAPSWHNNIVEEWRLGNWAGSCCVGKVHRLVDGGWSQNVGSSDKILASLL